VEGEHIAPREDLVQPGRLDVAEMFDKAAALLAERLDIDKAALLEKFQAREKQSTTVIQPGLAIPHVVVDGRGLFAILLVRCREGIAFAGEQQPVHTAFILVGSQDERNYHLRALMAIAHIVQEKDFERRWLAAPKAEHLRDILLLSDRERSSDT
jgi:mannitol/fructose-specific phosphotransferase system IIA component (Ntr-type)